MGTQQSTHEKVEEERRKVNETNKKLEWKNVLQFSRETEQGKRKPTQLGDR